MNPGPVGCSGSKLPQQEIEVSAASPHVKPWPTETCTADPASAGAGAAPTGGGAIVTIVAASANVPISAAPVDRIVRFEKCPMVLSVAHLRSLDL